MDVAQVAVTIDRLRLPTHTARRARCMLLRSHIEELAERVPAHLVGTAGRDRVIARLWSVVGEPSLAHDQRAHWERVIRGLARCYRELSDVLHGRRIELCPDPAELIGWAQSIREGCLLVPYGSRCELCNRGNSDGADPV